MIGLAMIRSKRGFLDRRNRSKRCGARICRLTEMPCGQHGRVVNISTVEQRRFRKFMAMGIMPGVSITLVQRFPSYVFQVGFTQVTMDSETAMHVEVEID